jgi:hypothetical protein
VEADGINAERGLQVGGDFTEHLVDLDHLDGRAGPVKPKRLAELINNADVDTGLKAAPEINSEFVRLPVGAGGEDAVARGHQGKGRRQNEECRREWGANDANGERNTEG